jgi:hypothetical protein
MVALTTDRSTARADGTMQAYGIAAATVLFAGSIGVINAAGFLTKGITGLGLRCVGRIAERYDNTTGANAAITGQVEAGIFKFANLAADLVTIADIGNDCFIADDQTVAKTNGAGTRSRAGKIINIDATGVFVRMGAEY